MASKTIIRKIIHSSLGLKPVGPYNQAIQVDRTVYLSGVVGLDPTTNKLVEGGISMEARQSLINMKNVLEAANSSFDNVIKVTIFLNNIEDFAAVNDVYKEFFTKNFPARSTFQVGKLPLGAGVEIEAIALSGEVETQLPSNL
ncbi:rutC family protein UK114 [Prorops nasuta]|uniref:rutC family protein UK114 n=1 Tax=Prorops nasuta TaxID=863751 RepID=UPI0034CD9310